MELELHRCSGHLGQAVPLEVFADDHRVGSVRVNECFRGALPPSTAEVRVSMQGTIGSYPYRLRAGAQSVKLECGNPLWVAFEFFSLCYLPQLRDRAYSSCVK